MGMLLEPAFQGKLWTFRLPCLNLVSKIVTYICEKKIVSHIFRFSESTLKSALSQCDIVGQHNIFWWPGYLCHHVISSQLKYVKYTFHCLLWPTFTQSVEIPSMWVPHPHFAMWGPGRIWVQSGYLRSDGVDRFYGPTSVCIGFNLCLFCFLRLPVSERGSQYQQLFHWFSKYKLKVSTEIYKEILAGLKLGWSLYDKY